MQSRQPLKTVVRTDGRIVKWMDRGEDAGADANAKAGSVHEAADYARNEYWRPDRRVTRNRALFEAMN